MSYYGARTPAMTTRVAHAAQFLPPMRRESMIRSSPTWWGAQAGVTPRERLRVWNRIPTELVEGHEPRPAHDVRINRGMGAITVTDELAVRRHNGYRPPAPKPRAPVSPPEPRERERERGERRRNRWRLEDGTRSWSLDTCAEPTCAPASGGSFFADAPAAGSLLGWIPFVALGAVWWYTRGR